MADKQKCSREMEVWIWNLGLADPCMNRWAHSGDELLPIDTRWSVLTQRDKEVGIKCAGHKECAKHINYSRDVVNRFLTNMMRNAK